MRRVWLVLALMLAMAPRVDAQEAPAMTECEAATAGILGQMIPPALSSSLARWFGLTAEYIGLPEGCERPYLPPETPWCYDDQGYSWCVDHVAIVHMESPSMVWFCYWIDPAATSSFDDGPFTSASANSDWHCVYPPV
jgi:hypothetical protein